MTNTEADEVDYLVVGGGSAGCVVASRLSEQSDASVHLLEIGNVNNSFLVRWPAGYARLQGEKTRFEWFTVPQKNLLNRRIPTPQGKVLGGGSTINSMIYIRGNRRDYDHWAAQGNDLWSYSDVLPYFKMCEDNEKFVNEYHGRDGFLGVADQRFPNELSRLFIRAAQEVGHTYNPDFNGAQQSGVGLFQVTQRASQRCSAAHAYIYPNKNRKNLRISTRCRANRIVVENDRAVGVEFHEIDSGKTRTIRARREVIVSSGTIGSAKLLLLSGIGPADEISSHGIKVVHDLPGVGKNYQDHLSVYAGISLTQPLSYSNQDKGLAMLRHGLEFLLFGSGAINSNVCEGGLFVNTVGDEDWPNIQMHFVPAQLSMHKAGIGHGVSLLAAHMRPKSRGEVRLSSARPEDEPSIDPRFLSESYDLERNIDGLERAREIIHAPAFRNVFKEESFPGKEIRTRTQLGEYVREVAKTDFHPVGTCRMGSDEMAVVDQHLRVRGVEGLRVVDNSIMPTIIAGNTNAAAIMIGERGAAAIKGKLNRLD